MSQSDIEKEIQFYFEQQMFLMLLEEQKISESVYLGLLRLSASRLEVLGKELYL